MSQGSGKIVIEDPEDRVRIRAAIHQYRNVVVRMRAKEIVGSEVYELRGRELQRVDSIIARLP